MTKYILPSNFIIANPRYNLNATSLTYRNIMNKYHCGKNGTFDSFYPCFILNDTTYEFKVNNKTALNEVIVKESPLPNKQVSIGRLEGFNNPNIEKKIIDFSSIVFNFGGFAPELYNSVDTTITSYYVIPGVYENLIKISNLISIDQMNDQNILIPGTFYVTEKNSSTNSITIYICEVQKNPPISNSTIPIGQKFLVPIDKTNTVFYALAISKNNGKIADIFESRTFNPYQDDYENLVTWHISYF